MMMIAQRVLVYSLFFLRISLVVTVSCPFSCLLASPAFRDALAPESAFSKAHSLCWKVLAKAVQEATGRPLELRITSAQAHLALQEILSDSNPFQIEAMFWRYGRKIVAALEVPGTPVTAWGMPLKLSEDGKAVVVDTVYAPRYYNPLMPIQIGDERLAYAPKEMKDFRKQRHLALLQELGHLAPHEDLHDVDYDELGHIRFRKRLQYKDGWITYSYANTKPFDLDGSVPDLISLLDEHPPEHIRYLVFKRLVKHRAAAKDYLTTIRRYEYEDIEPSPMVRAEAGVALRMIEGGTVHNHGERLNIVFATYEAEPLIKKGGLADVSGTLPRVLTNKTGHDVSVVMPFWPSIRDELRKLPHVKLVDENIQFRLDGQWVRVFSVEIDDTKIYLLENDAHFDVGESDDIYREKMDKAYQKQREGTPQAHNTHPKNAQTSIFFSKAMLEATARLAERDRWNPDIINTADWQTGLIPALLKKSPAYKDREIFRGVKTVHTIHNLAYKGMFEASPDAQGGAKALWDSMGLPRETYKPDNLMGLEAWGNVSLMKAGIVFADVTTTVSEGYAAEIKTPEFGDGFQKLFAAIPWLEGIINGISRRQWNTETAPNLQFHYGVDPSEEDQRLGVLDEEQGKRWNRLAVNAELDRLELENPENREGYLKDRSTERIPLVLFAARFDQIKGADVLLPALEKLLSEGKTQIVFNGKGDEGMEQRIRDLVKRYPGNAALARVFGPRTLQPLMAAADICEMPSLKEPCGLVDQQAMRYATVPIVNAVGGLKDKVTDFAADPQKGNGYVMHFHGKDAFAAVQDAYDTLLRAFGDFQDPVLWAMKRRRVLERSEDLSWEASALKYERLYRALLHQALDQPGSYTEPGPLDIAA